jgi:hypothetical protein
MKQYNRLHLFVMLQTAIRLVLFSAFVIPGIAMAQTTMNAFVGATVNQGLITFFKGDPANKEQLSFIETSYLTVKVNGLFYSNNPNGGMIGSTTHPIDVVLVDDQTAKKGDTITTFWNENGFDIVQNVYPVAFSTSGVIVLSISIVNYTGSSLPAQSQYLMDNENSNTTGEGNSSNDNPFIIENNNSIRNWQDFPPKPLPSFFLTYEFAPSTPSRGTVGIAYLNDSFPPIPLGLMPLSFLEFGNWPTQVNYTFGPPPNGNPPRDGFGDEATLMMGQNMQANGGSDSVTEIMRTAFGTPPASFLNSSVSSQSGPTVNMRLEVFPNPLSASATLNYFLPSPSSITISIFDALGREVACPVIGEEQDAGDHEATFDAHGLEPGVYTCRLIANGEEQTAKIVVTR